MIQVSISDDVQWYENFDLETIITPVKVDRLRELLEETGYDKEKTKFLVKGFTEGFSLGYQGPKNRRTFARNHKLQAGSPVVLWNKLMKEVKNLRLSGPYTEPPYEEFIQSPITLIKTKGSTSEDPDESTRLIVDLSWPHGDSLNDHTPESVKKVKYPLFDKSIHMCLAEGKGCYLSRTDCKSAFLMLPLAPDQFKWVVLMCRHPVSGVKYYFCVKTVIFGSGTSCFLYMKLSNALAHIFRVKSGGDINNFLDDFLTCKIDEEGCNGYLQLFINICQDINLPLSIEKTCFATQIIVFLGLLINSVTQTISIPDDKIERGKAKLDLILRSKKITVHQLQRLTGLLNFFCRAVVPGRAFTRRLYAKYSGMHSYHHLRIDAEMKNDCRMWLEFLMMKEAVCRPFMDFSTVYHADELDFFTDGVLDGVRLGVGGKFGNLWFSGTLPVSLYQHELNIQIVELYSILLGLSLWMERLQNRRVVLFTDNESVMHMLKKSSSSCRVCMIMIRLITLWSMKFNVRVSSFHVSSEENKYADLLSRGRVEEFMEKSKGSVRESGEALPVELWPLPAAWLN